MERGAVAARGGRGLPIVRQAVWAEPGVAPGKAHPRQGRAEPERVATSVPCPVR
uniref:Uncharacterized protein n=1 Tax=mine drainage metagenome TaxID=410659 RepID=E6PJC0_9ZZZZ